MLQRSNCTGTPADHSRGLVDAQPGDDAQQQHLSLLIGQPAEQRLDTLALANPVREIIEDGTLGQLIGRSRHDVRPSRPVSVLVDQDVPSDPEHPRPELRPTALEPPDAAQRAHQNVVRHVFGIVGTPSMQEPHQGALEPSDELIEGHRVSDLRPCQPVAEPLPIIAHHRAVTTGFPQRHQRRNRSKDHPSPSDLTTWADA